MPSGPLVQIGGGATRTTFRLPACGHEALAWSGRCAGCGEWNTLVERRPRRRRAAGRRAGAARRCGRKPVALRDVAAPGVARLAPGSPSSTACSAAASSRARWCCSAARRDRQVDAHRRWRSATSPRRAPRCSTSPARSRPRRSGCEPSGSARRALDVPALAETALETVGGDDRGRAPRGLRRRLDPDAPPASARRAGIGGPGPRGGRALMEVAKRPACAVVLVGHVTKEGAVAGPRALEHLVDACSSSRASASAHRTLRALKNRFGPTSEVGVFEMRTAAWSRSRTPARFVGEATAAPGSVVLCAMEGTRPLLVEVQALVAPTESSRRGGSRRRRPQRLAMILAVLPATAGLGRGARTSSSTSPAACGWTSPAPTWRSRWRWPRRSGASRSATTGPRPASARSA